MWKVTGTLFEILVMLTIVSQVIIPIFLPSYFKFFWLFRKKEKQPEKSKSFDEELEHTEKEFINRKDALNESVEDIEDKFNRIKNLKDKTK